MPSVTVPRDRVAAGSLPDVCLICGNQAPNQQFATLGAPAQFWILAPGLGLIVFWGHVLWSARFRSALPGGLPFCNRHRFYWVRRARFIIGGWVFLVASMWVGLLLSDLKQRDAVPHWTFMVAICWLLFFLPAFIVVHLASMRPTVKDDDSLTLSGASRQFIDAFETY